MSAFALPLRMTDKAHHLRRLLTGSDVKLAPQDLNISEGLRSAAACATIVALASLMHRPDFSWAVVAAFWTCLTDPGGNWQKRALTMGSFALIATCVTMFAKGLAAYGAVFAAPVVLVVVFLCMFARIYGGAPTQIGTLAAVACVIAADRPAFAASDNLSATIVFFCGCIWAIVLSIAFWRNHPERPARLAIAALYKTLTVMTADTAKFDSRPDSNVAEWTTHNHAHRRAVREEIEAARAALTALAREQSSPEIDRLLVAIEAASRIFAQLIVIAYHVENRGEGHMFMRHRALKSLAVLLERIARCVENNVPMAEMPPALLQSAAHLIEMSGELDPAIGQPLLASAQLLRNLVRSAAGSLLPVPAPPGPSLAEQILGPLKANLSWDSLALRHAFRCAVATMLAYSVEHLLGLPYGYWLTLTVIVIQQPYVATTWPRTLERVAGSVLGGAFAAGLSILLHSHLAILLAIFPLAIATMAMRGVNYSLFVFFLTTQFILIIGLTQPGTDDLSVALARALNSAIGGALGLICSLALWPSWEPERLRNQLAQAIIANGLFAAESVRLPDGGASKDQLIEEARRQAGLASNNAEVSRQRVVLESFGRNEMLDVSLTLLVLLRKLAATAFVAWLYPAPGGDPGFADWCAGMSRALAATLNSRSALAPWQGRDESLMTDQQKIMHQQFAMLHGAVQRFVTASAD